MENNSQSKLKRKKHTFKMKPTLENYKSLSEKMGEGNSCYVGNILTGF